MNCQTSKEYISQMLDNELGNEFLQPLFQHLAECSECRSFYTRTQRIQQTMQRLPVSELSATVDEKFDVLTMGTKKQSFRNWKISISIPSAVYSVCAVLVIGLFMYAVGSYQEQVMGNQYRSTISSLQQRSSPFADSN